MSDTNKHLYMSLDEYSRSNRYQRGRGKFGYRYQSRRYNSSYDNNNNSYHYRQGTRNRMTTRNGYISRRGGFTQRRQGEFISYRPRYRQSFRTNYKKRSTFAKDNNNKSGSNNQTESKTRLVVSNLHNSVVNPELKKIFDSIGPLKRCGVRWDKLGNSLGTADVEYDSPLDAAQAIKSLNNAEIEGVMMKVEYNNEKQIAPKTRVFKKRLGYRRNFNNKSR